MPRDFDPGPARLSIPDMDRSTGRRQRLTPRTEGNRAHTRQAGAGRHEAHYRLACIHVPVADLAVASATRQRSVGTERDGLEGILILLMRFVEGMSECAVGRGPDLDRQVRAPRGQKPSVRAEGDALDKAGMSLNLSAISAFPVVRSQ